MIFSHRFQINHFLFISFDEIRRDRVETRNLFNRSPVMTLNIDRLNYFQITIRYSLHEFLSLSINNTKMINSTNLIMFNSFFQNKSMDRVSCCIEYNNNIIE